MLICVSIMNVQQVLTGNFNGCRLTMLHGLRLQFQILGRNIGLVVPKAIHAGKIIISVEPAAAAHPIPHPQFVHKDSPARIRHLHRVATRKAQDHDRSARECFVAAPGRPPSAGGIRVTGGTPGQCREARPLRIVAFTGVSQFVVALGAIAVVSSILLALTLILEGASPTRWDVTAVDRQNSNTQVLLVVVGHQAQCEDDSSNTSVHHCGSVVATTQQARAEHLVLGVRCLQVTT